VYNYINGGNGNNSNNNKNQCIQSIIELVSQSAIAMSLYVCVFLSPKHFNSKKNDPRSFD
jgi:hypothetical protein